ncbi:MAG TPA: hypothetical protein PKC80_04480 [Burkholderiaceae bacterium]|nr:hypothetical protein [Burkholderiaceae bacterium]
MNWLDRFPLWLLIVLAVYLGIAPIQPEPHLVEKLRMLSQVTLTRPLDIFDLLMHATPIVLLAIRVWRQFVRAGKLPK